MPMYPLEAKEQGTEGRVVLKMVVTKEGTALDPVVFNSSHEGLFDASAIEAVKQYKFTPGTIKGKPVDCIVRIPVVYALQPQQPPQQP